MGLAMFLPLLEMVADQNADATAEQMGNLSFVLHFVEWLGYGLNLTVVLLTMFLFFTLKGVFVWIEQYLGIMFRQFFIRKIRIEVIQFLDQYRFSEFVMADAGRIQNTMTGEVARVVGAYRTYSIMMQKLVLLCTYTFLAFLSNPRFAVMVAIGGLITNLLFRLMYKKTKILSRKLVNYNHGFQGLLIQQVTFFKYLKATGLISNYSENLKRKVVEIEQTQRGIGVLNSLMLGVREPLMIGIVVSVILIQVNWMGDSLGLIILSILFFYRALTAITQLQTQYNRFLEFSGSLYNFRVFANELKVGREKTGGWKFSNFKENIRLENVSFAYQGKKILTNISLQLNRHETVALVGESGSGKTTLMNILSGLLPPEEGLLTIDGVDCQELDLPTYQRHIGYITQEPVIFDDSIYNNVTFWSEKNEDNLKRFQEALQKASIWEFVSQLPDKENARLGNNGINLSGGQKQRLSIARELYKEVDFLFMDEATSALDSETELSIQQNIDSLKGQYTDSYYSSSVVYNQER